MRKRVLIADDERSIAEALSFLLDRAGYEVVLAPDGSEALSVAAQTELDLVILDLMLPNINGHEVLAELRANERTNGLPVIILTAKGQREDRDAAVAAGADHFLTKPFSNAELLDLVRRACEEDPI